MVETSHPLKECELAVFDIDGCIVDGRIASSVLPIIKEERKNKNWKNYFRGILGGASVVLGINLRSGLKAENKGLKKAVEVLGEAGIEKERIESKVGKYYEEHRIEGFEELKGALEEEDIGLYLTSCSADLFVEPLAKKLEAVGYTCHETIYDGDTPIGVKLRMKDSTRKYVETFNDLRKMGFDLRDCAFYGNHRSDLDLLEGSNVSIASPLAKPEVREACQIKLDETYGYKQLAIELKNSF